MRGELLLPFNWEKKQKLRKVKRGREYSPGASMLGVFVGMRKRTKMNSELAWNEEWGQEII